MYAEFEQRFFGIVYRYRFMVMDRLGIDLQKVLQEGGGRFPKHTVLQLGCLLVSLDHCAQNIFCLSVNEMLNAYKCVMSAISHSNINLRDFPLKTLITLITHHSVIVCV